MFRSLQVFHLVLCLFMSVSLWAAEKSPLYIGHVSPVNGNELERAMFITMQDYFDLLNAKGGVDGHPIEMVVVDSEGDADVAYPRVQELVKDQRILLVLGHYYSEVAVCIGKLYEAAQIPAISSKASSSQVVEDNDWFFMLTPNTKTAGMTLAYYVYYVLKARQVGMIFDPNDAFSTSADWNFRNTFSSLGGDIAQEWAVATHPQNLKTSLDLNNAGAVIAQDVKDQPDLVLLDSLLSKNSAPVIISLRRSGAGNRIIGNISNEVLDLLKRTPEEIRSPGYFSDSIYGATGLMFDLIGRRGQLFRQSYFSKLGRDPNLAEAFAYDTAQLAVQILRDLHIDGSNVSLQRKQIRDYLANMNDPTRAYEGVTGLIYFDKNGLSMKPPAIGLFKNQQTIPAFTQFSPVKNYKNINNFEELVRAGEIVGSNGEYMYKTHIVYTGIEINNIEEVDPVAQTYLLDFVFWFRSRIDIDANNIEFLNTNETIKLGKPLKRQEQDGMLYSLYHVKARFTMDFLPQYKELYALGYHVFGVQFRHRQLPQHRLIYVDDVLTHPSDETAVAVQALNAIPGFSEDWTVDRVLAFQDVDAKQARGNPNYLEYGTSVDFSRFNLAIGVKSKQFTLRRVMEAGTANIVFAVSLGLLLSLVWWRGWRYRIFRPSLGFRLTWWLQVLTILVLLLSAESVALTYFSGNDSISTQSLITLFDILWWAVPAMLIVNALDRCLWKPIEVREGYKIPLLMRGLGVFIVYMLAFFGILAFVFNMHITSLLAASGLLATIVGLAIETNISNVFSGIAINVDRPFRIGDWIKIGNYPIGKVTSISWRATCIETSEGNILSIPNAVAADSTVYNYYYPTDVCTQCLTIHLAFEHPPEKVRHIILNAMRPVKGILSEPPPSVSFNLGKWSADYTVCFKIHDYGQRGDYLGKVSERIFVDLKAAGVMPLSVPT